jgi:hypothetical protein
VELSGQSPWLGDSAAFVIDPAQLSAAGDASGCCGATTICVPTTIGTNPVCGPDGYCTGPIGSGFGVTSNLPPGMSMGNNPVQVKVFASCRQCAGHLV